VGLQFGVSYLGGDQEFVRVRRWPFSIGRNPSNDLCLSNSSHISRRHARIVRDADGGYRLIASGRNPTYVNGKRIPRDEPVGIGPGDRIELPDYLLEVRDTAWNDRPGATVNVEVVQNSVVVVRRVASAVGLTSWTAEAIHGWLTAVRGREVWIRHHHVELCLPGRVSIEQLRQRVELFDELIAHLDPHALTVAPVDPRSLATDADEDRAG
jgi:hypothetical protein